MADRLSSRLAAVPVSKVELQISCSNLLNMDVLSKSDPCVVLLMKNKSGWFEVGRTENIKNCLSPQFVRTMDLDYYFEEVQQLSFAVYDIDNTSPKLSDDDFLGQMNCTLGQLVSLSPYVKPLLKRNGTNAGSATITVRAEEISKLNDVMNLSFEAKHLDKKDFLSKSDPYLEFSRQLADGTWQVVHRTEVINNNLNPTWKTFAVKVQKLCAGNYEAPIKVACFDWDDADAPDLIGQFTTTVPELTGAPPGGQIDCYDYDDDGSHDFIGTSRTTAREMMEAVDRQVEWQCINEKKKAKKSSYKNSGVVRLLSCQITKEYSFLDYVFGGLQINFTVAVDFTASNGDPLDPRSLHFLNRNAMNEYQRAIQAVGEVIQDYDSDQMFPVLGFGAKVPPNMTVSHEFALNFNPTNPFCAGIQGVLQTYQACLPQIKLYGPTNFSPVIEHVARFAKAAADDAADAKSYSVLLILTDGVITDMPETLSSLVRASRLPMSVIIVGVGGADFAAMELLDGDDGVLRSGSGEAALRDIVQFVPFREVQGAGAELAHQVLAEVPQQVCDYFRRTGQPPMNAAK